jgi:hypothetical protein
VLTVVKVDHDSHLGLVPEAENAAVLMREDFVGLAQVVLAEKSPEGAFGVLASPFHVFHRPTMTGGVAQVGELCDSFATVRLQNRSARARWIRVVR